MSQTYAKPIPVDRNGTALQEYPPVASAIAVLARDNATTSSVTTLSPNTTVVEVAAVTAGAVVKWASSNVGSVQGVSVISAAGTANFDHFIPAGTYRKFVVPRLTAGIPNTNNQGSPSMVGLNVSEGLFGHIATKSTGVGSVLLTEY